MSGGALTVLKRRWYNPAPGTFPATALDTDEHGLWFRTEPLTLHRDHEGRVVYIATHAWLGLAPPDQRWLAMFAGGNWKVDISMPVTITDTEIDFTDLELDVVVRRSPQLERARIVDQDEFDALHLPAGLAATCQRTAAKMAAAIDQRLAPFDAALDERIAEVVESDPLVHAGDLVRHGWIAPAFEWVRERVLEEYGSGMAEHFDRQDRGDVTVLVGGMDADVHVVVLADHAGPVELLGTRRSDVTGLDALVELSFEAGKRLLA